MLFTFTVSIGRNIGGTTEPLRKDVWREFIWAVTSTVEQYAHATFFEGEGVGSNPYADPPTFEDSYTMVGDIFAREVGNLSDALVPLARRYRQESIALTVGTTTFVGEVE